MGIGQPFTAADVTVVVPVYLNAATLGALVARIDAAMRQSECAPWRILFVVDASPDESWSIVRGLAANDSRVGGILLRRRVGQHAAILAGLASARSAWLVVIDADLQDPPEAIPVLLERARNIHGAVFAGRRGRYERWDRMMTSRVFKTVLRWVSGVPEDVGTFFVVADDVARAMCRVTVSTPQAVVLAHACASRRDTMAVTRSPRVTGRSAYSSAARVRAGIRSLRCALECRSRGEGEGPARDFEAPIAERVNA